MQYRKTLSFKINLLILSITSLSMLFTTVFYIQKQKNIFLSTLKKNGETLCRNLALDSQYGVWSDDKNDLENYMKGMMTDQNVFLVFIENNKGKIIAFNDRYLGKDLTPLYKRCRTVRSSSIQGEMINYNSKNFLYFYSKIRILKKHSVYTALYELPQVHEKSEDLGYANVIFSLNEMEQELAVSKKEALILSMIFFLIFSVLGYYFSQGIVQPILMLVESTKKIASGDLDVCLPLQTGNEIGLLSFSFQEMIQNIKEKNALKEHVLAVEKSASIGKLAGGLAHEFNNILSSISTEAEASLEMNDFQYIRESLQNIMETVRVGTSITRNLLNYAKPSPPTFSMTNIRELLKRTLDLIRQELMHFGIHYTIDGNPDLICPIDAQQIQHVFLNILTNARDAMRNGGTLAISVTEESGFALISFKDTGEGIDETDILKVFEPFYTTKGDYGKSHIPGTGLGLFISREIIRNHKGSIFIYNRTGGGIDVQVHLPLNG
jgi:signal transduction histidine kinase